ncbi:hypothetical protein PFISCL1PPCAC_12865, partial [Pristionchus fissidentatus]
GHTPLRNNVHVIISNNVQYGTNHNKFEQEGKADESVKRYEEERKKRESTSQFSNNGNARIINNEQIGQIRYHKQDFRNGFTDQQRTVEDFEKGIEELKN